MNDNLVDFFTEERVDKLYAATNDSVALINDIYNFDLTSADPMDVADFPKTMAQNRDHIQHMLTFDVWAGRDVTAWADAVQKANDYLA